MAPRGDAGSSSDRYIGADSMAAAQTGESTLEICCARCGDYFDVSDGEREWFERKGFALPKRCKPCRAVRRAGPLPLRYVDS